MQGGLSAGRQEIYDKTYKKNSKENRPCDLFSCLYRYCSAYACRISSLERIYAPADGRTSACDNGLYVFFRGLQDLVNQKGN